MPDFTHIAIYRNEFGDVTHRELIFLPLGNDEEALAIAQGRNRVSDALCDVFELHGAHRCGGWRFRQERHIA